MYPMVKKKSQYLVEEGNIPASSILVTQLNLSRFREGSSNNSGGCELDWQIRPIFNIYSGGVDLMRIPVCN